MAKQDAGQLSDGTIAVSAFRVFRNAFLGAAEELAKSKVDWDALDDEQQFAWFSVAERAVEILEDCENLPWVKFAEELFKVWARRMDYPIQEFRDMPPATQAGWTAVARHVANLCAIEADDDLAEHEARWIGAAGRLGQAVGVS